VVRNLPTNKAPGPSGFNTYFLKKYWSIVYEDFYSLCDAFHSENICLQSINGSHITLIPKKDDALTYFLIEHFCQAHYKAFG
jgi:hypothetical protein